MNPKGLPRSFAFKIAPQARAGKLDRLEAVQAEWSRVLPLAFAWHWRGFLRGRPFENLPRSGPKSTFPKTKLVTSQKDLMAAAIQGQAQGWASNLKNRFAKALMRMENLDPKLRREMLWINSMRAWTLPLNAPPAQPGKISQMGLLAAQPAKPGAQPPALASISPRASRLMRKLFWAYVSAHRLPDPSGLPLQVNQQSCEWGPAKRSASKWAHSWLSVASLERGKRIMLPLLGHDHAEARGGKRAKTFSLAKRGGEWFATSTQYVEPKPWAKSGVEVLGIDLGMRNLVATSEGDLFGRGFLGKLSKLDRELMKVQKGLQEAGEKRLSACKRYRKVVERPWAKR